MNHYYVYILTNYENTTLYIGVTGNIERRTFEHKLKVQSGFAEKYNCYKLVYLEEYANADEAIAREKQLKGWSRVKKENLICSVNPEWNNLFQD